MRGRWAISKLDLFARGLDQFAELHAGGTGRLTGAAAEAAIHVIDKLRRNSHASFSHCLHLVNTPPRRIHLYAQHGIGWAGRQAEAAVDALAHQIVGMSMAAQRPFNWRTDRFDGVA